MVSAHHFSESPGRDDGQRVTDEDLVQRARRGDVRAFEGLFRKHVGRVYAVCLRLLSDPDLAEEVTQETFIRTWRSLGSFEGDKGFAAWLFRIAVNSVLINRRTASRRAARIVAIDDVSMVSDDSPGLDPGERMDLESALRKLPEQARAVFVLHDVEGYRHEEIGDMLNIAGGTSKAHLHRARRMLRKILIE